ncbi:MAG: hypothetical protein ABL952_01505, partial [Pyrinomonadaceae bacterium]
DARADVFALGICLYEVLTGRLPFQTENEFELMKAQTERMPTRPREINPAISEAVEAAILKAIQKEPDARFQSGGDFRATLLEAGFSGDGQMHGATGMFNKPSTRPSNPPVSASDAKTLVSAEIAPAMKETRLGEPAPSAAGAAMKATRLGEPVTAPVSGMKATRLGTMSEAAGQSTAAPASFFSKLTAVHYAAAGLVVLFLVGQPLLTPRQKPIRRANAPRSSPVSQRHHSRKRLRP